MPRLKHHGIDVPRARAPSSGNGSQLLRRVAWHPLVVWIGRIQGRRIGLSAGKRSVVGQTLIACEVIDGWSPRCNLSWRRAVVQVDAAPVTACGASDNGTHAEPVHQRTDRPNHREAWETQLHNDDCCCNGACFHGKQDAARNSTKWEREVRVGKLVEMTQSNKIRMTCLDATCYLTVCSDLPPPSRSSHACPRLETAALVGPSY